VITGPIEPATSKNLKTTRRYATQERAQDSPAAPREVATPPPARQLPVSPAEPVGSTTQPLPGIPVLPPQAPAVPGFEPQQRLTPPPALPSYPELPASAAEEVEGAAPAPSAAPAARALERESTDVDPDAEREITDVDPDAEREITDVDPDAERATDPVAEALPAPAVSARDAAPTTVNPAVEPWIVAAEAATARPQVKPTVRMDGAAINSMLRMDAEHAFSQRPAVGYASIQREVWSAGNEQAEAEIEAVEVERAEQNLLDTIREAPAEIEFTEDGIERHVNPFPLFSDLDASAFLAVVRRVERRVCPPGTVIFNEGDPGDSLYLVASGVLQVLKDPGGQPIQLARLGSGSFFGEFGLLTDGRRHATVRCLEECELLELRREVLIELSAEHPTISWTLRTFYQQRVMAMVMATSPLFQAVSAEERKSVLARFTFRRFMAGEQIVREGKQGTGFYVILVGTALVTCMAADGSDMKLGVLGEGNYFGEMSLLSGCVAEASVRAETVIEVLMLEPQDFYSMAAEHPEIWAVVQDEAERRREDTAQRLARGAAAAVNRLCLI
jgi:CRP-like cAMP-binding protein